MEYDESAECPNCLKSFAINVGQSSNCPHCAVQLPKDVTTVIEAEIEEIKKQGIISSQKKAEFKEKWGYRVAVVSLILAIMAVRQTYGIYEETSSINIAYLFLCIFGLTGSILSMFRISGGKLLLIAFYAMQAIIIFRPTWQYKVTPGFSFPFYILEGSDPTLVTQNPIGYGINVFAFLMLIFTFLWVQTGSPVNNQKDS